MIKAAQLTRLRYDRGLTQRKLAAACGVDPLTITRLEAGADGRELPLGVVAAMARALGTGIDILTQTEPDARTPDREPLVQTIGTSIFNGHTSQQDIAFATGATKGEIESALQDVEDALRPLGLALVSAGDEVWCAPSGDARQKVNVAGPMSLTQAHLLRRIQRGEDVRRSMTKSQRLEALPALIRSGLVEIGVAGLEPSHALRRSLLGP